MSSVIRVKAPAKLNLFLHITGRRDDGYHLLQSLFVPIALYDSLVFKQNGSGRVRRLNAIDGIDEDDVIMLLDYGYSADEIEDMFMDYDLLRNTIQSIKCQDYYDDFLMEI